MYEINLSFAKLSFGLKYAAEAPSTLDPKVKTYFA